MISINFVFWVFVAFTAVIGLLRGWAKETLVSISAIFAIYLIVISEGYIDQYLTLTDIRPEKDVMVQAGDTCEKIAQDNSVPLDDFIEINAKFYQNFEADCFRGLTSNPSITVVKIPIDTTRFYVSSTIILLSAFIGYQTPLLKPFQSAVRRENVRDSVLGAILGGWNGYLIFGSIWWFLQDAGYEYFQPTLSSPPIAETAATLMSRMPPEFLMQQPLIYFVIAFFIVLVLAIFI